jgi:hypothetical protein
MPHAHTYIDHEIWNAATHALTQGGRPAAALTACHSPMDALTNSYRLALVRTHAMGRDHGPFPFPRDARADEVSEVLYCLKYMSSSRAAWRG